MKTPKVYVIKRENSRSEFTMSGTVAELVYACSYTLECGHSYEHEKGRSKINCNPTTIKSLVTNLNKAVNNSAANGYADVTYSLVVE